MNNSFYIFFTFCLFGLACSNGRKPKLEKGQVISESLVIEKDTFRLNGADSLGQAVILIKGDNITVDFNGAVLMGSNDKHEPDEFYGTGILVKGNNITLKNAIVRGFKIGLMGEGVDSLKLIDCDFSYNFRQHLKSTREREDFADWLSHHQNDKDEWLRYGAGIYLKECDHALVQNVKITGGQNGLMMTKCNEGLFYNNIFQFNSGLGIGMYRSSRNKIMHNRLDWNVRGYSHGIYQRGQDSAGILVYEQSNGNIFAYNSATHSGDGFFLWAGQTSMDSGEGGCNDNMIYENDFSYAPTNGVEVTFSSNKIIGNKMEECKYGIWGGYSYESDFLNNIIENCNYGIAVEHGNNNKINDNYFRNNTTGVQLWERKTQPKDWGFAEKRNVQSRAYTINNNYFISVKNTLDIKNTSDILLKANTTYNSEIIKNTIDEKIAWHAIENTVTRAEPPFPNIDHSHQELILKLSDGNDTQLKESQLQGRQYILVDEWGPYDFQSPSIWLRNIEEEKYIFLLLCPSVGNYKIIGGEGWAKLNRVSGAFPATLIATKKTDAELLTLNLEFIGEAFIDRFGNTNKKGKVFPFNFARFEKKMEWKVRFYNYDENTDPIKDYTAFKNLKNNTAQKTDDKNELYYAWWGSPGEGLNADQFATFSETTFKIEKGKYRISLTSDDGAKLLLDGKLLIENWTVHEPETDEIEIDLGGQHRIEIEHFETGGFGTLDFRIAPVL